jgi:hypothetical protein
MKKFFKNFEIKKFTRSYRELSKFDKTKVLPWRYVQIPAVKDLPKLQVGVCFSGEGN